MDSLEKTYLKIKIVLLSLVGIVFFIFVVSNWDSIVEFNLAGVGSIKMEARQDLDAIKDIRRQVEKDSKRIEDVARKAEQAQEVINSVKAENAVVKNQLKDISKLQSEAQETIKNLNITLQFARTFISAYSDDRKAYNQLIAWSKDKNYLFKKEAQSAFISILEKHNQPFSKSGFVFPWKKGFDPSKLTISQIKAGYFNTVDYLKPALLEFVWRNIKYSKYDKMKFMVIVLKKDNSLRAVEYAGRYFASGANIKVSPLATDLMLEWWGQNKDKIR